MNGERNNHEVGFGFAQPGDVPQSIKAQLLEHSAKRSADSQTGAKVWRRARFDQSREKIGYGAPLQAIEGDVVPLFGKASRGSAPQLFAAAPGEAGHGGKESDPHGGTLLLAALS